MIVQHNMSAMNANRMLGTVAAQQAKSTEKLSSGYRINRAGDDAAGLAISEKMRGQIRGLNQASSNAQDGISLIQTAEGALTETHSILQRMRELAVQASSDTNTDDDRTQLQNEINQLTSEVDRIANTTEFNTKKLLDGSQTGAVDEKAGTLKVDGDFSNSNVSVNITTNNSEKAAISDVIRLEITQNFKEGQSTKSTPKLSDSDINNIYNLITDPVTADPGPDAAITFGSGDTKVEIKGDFKDTNSVEENINAAKENAESTLATLTDALTKSSNAVANNEKTVSKTAKMVMEIADATKKDEKTILKSTTTQKDLEDAINSYIDALVEDGEAAGAGDSTKITEAKGKLESLFSDDTTTKAGGTLDAAAKTFAFEKANNAKDDTIKNLVITADTTILKVAATDIYGKLEAYAQGVAGVEIENKNNQEKVNIAKGVIETLDNKEFAKAIVDYKEAEKALSDAAATDDTTDEKKAELQEKVDVAKAKLDKLNEDKNVLSVQDLFGSSDDIKNFKIGEKLDDNNNLTITMKNKEGDDTTITIANADKLKAGDTVLITSQEMVESKQAAVGKSALRLQIGANAGQEVALGINSMKAVDLNIVQTKEGKEGQALDVTNQASASLAVNAYDLAIQRVSTERAKMGATQNRLEHTISNLDTSAENLQSAESRIRDTDMASEMVSFSKNNIIQQAAQSMLSQANQSTQGALSLLQ